LQDEKRPNIQITKKKKKKKKKNATRETTATRTNLLVEHWLRLTTETFLFGIITTFALRIQAGLARLVLSHLFW
jgi:hypothetical protein